jgi:hypothetical protein
MNLRPETRRRLGATWYSLTREFTLPSGAYQARVVVRDRLSGHLGSVTHAFEVPSITGFRMSSPIVTDALSTDPTGQSAPKPVVVARRTFASGSTLYCQFTVYGAAVDASKHIQVSSSWVLRRADGTVVRQASPTAIAAGPAEPPVRMYGVNLSGLVPGDYELVVSVRDEIGVNTTEAREPFTVVTGVGVSPPAG